MAEPFQNQQAAAQRPRAGLTDAELNAVSYFAIGVGSEGGDSGRNVAYRLSFAGNIAANGNMAPVANSGLSIGTLQTDLGQHPEVARSMVDAYQTWARANHPDWVLNARQEQQTVADLGRTGDQIRADGGRGIDPALRTRLNQFLASDDGIRYVHNNDVQQAGRLMTNVYTPLRETALYQNATPEDQIRLATVVGKAYNQSEHWGGQVLANIQAGRYQNVDAVSNAVGDLLPGNRDYMQTGRNAALEGAAVLTALRNSDPNSPLRATWDNVLANPLVDPTRLAQDPARPNLAHEYATVKDLFLQRQEAPAFIQALDRGATSMHGQRTANGLGFVDDGLYAAGNNFVVWDRNGVGHAYTDGQWRDVQRDNLVRAANRDGTVDLSLNDNGVLNPLMRVDPRARPLRADAGGGLDLPQDTQRADVAVPQWQDTARVAAAAVPPGTQTAIQNPQHQIDLLSPKDREMYDQVAKMAKQAGLGEREAQSAALAMVASIKENPLIRNVNDIRVVNNGHDNQDAKMFASYMPYGQDREPMHTANVDLRQAATVPPEESLRRIDEVNQRQELDRQREQQREQQYAQRGPADGDRNDPSRAPRSLL